ncbi:MAG: hypothetical protein GY697_18420 [Desulfobacterales bacterium]|nr:hypothetical protein [Desulfobacterales bacterium]
MTQVILYYPDENRLTQGGLELISAWQESEQAVLWLSLDEAVSDEEKQILTSAFHSYSYP